MRASMHGIFTSQLANRPTLSSPSSLYIAAGHPCSLTGPRKREENRTDACGALVDVSLCA